MPLAWFIFCSQMLSLIQNFWVEKVLLVLNKISPKTVYSMTKARKHQICAEHGSKCTPFFIHCYLYEPGKQGWTWPIPVMWPAGRFEVMAVSLPQAHSQHPERVPESWVQGTDLPPPHSTAANCSSSQRSSHGLLQAKPKAWVLALVCFPKSTKYNNNKAPFILSIPNPRSHQLWRVKSLFFK